MGLLKTILFLLVVYYISKFLLRLWIRSKISEHSKRMQNSANHKEVHQQKVNKGKVTVHTKEQNSDGNHSSGEYVDYEEIK